jgi:epoxyqueuosine reductase
VSGVLVRAGDIRKLAYECGFELAGVAAAVPAPDLPVYHEWLAAGMAGGMGYLTDRRAGLRDDPRHLLPSARSVISVGKLYHTKFSKSTSFTHPQLGWISRYAWGDDYHDVLRSGLRQLESLLRQQAGDFESKICVDTAPLLERAYAREAGLGWIGKNTCLIREGMGSWFFLGELLVSLELEPDTPPPDLCGSCTRCIDACPTAALEPYRLDARRCISYFTIELRGPVPAEHRPGMGWHLFGCDICQDVCPWNRRAPVTDDPHFQPRQLAPPLEKLAEISEEDFRALFRGSPVKRAKYSGFLRNVAIAMGNSRKSCFRTPLKRLSQNQDAMVAEAARWALDRLN